jgi:hypothetical protein
MYSFILEVSRNLAARSILISGRAKGCSPEFSSGVYAVRQKQLLPVMVIGCAKRGVTRWLLFFVNGSSFCNPTPALKPVPRERLPSLMAVERGGTATKKAPPIFRRRFIF